MTTCPNCNTPNRAGAKFCSKCGASLPPSSKATIPLGDLAFEKLPPPAQAPSPKATVKLLPTDRTDTRPLNSRPVFAQRPVGAVFGDHFLMEKLVFTDDQQHQYIVTQFELPEEARFHCCPNPSCGAIHSPAQDMSDKFCIACGTPLGVDIPSLILIETSSPFIDSAVKIVPLHLTHQNVRPPLAIFEEDLAGKTRHCLVIPEVKNIPASHESIQVMKWGNGLASGLDYLHQNGISFEGNINDTCFGSVGDRLVWSNFSGINIYPEVPGASRLVDIRALAAQLFLWLTGKTQYTQDPNLPPGINNVFDQALASPGFNTAEQLAFAIEKALKEAETPVAVDFRTGRLTNVGMVRTLNEDSMLVIESSRAQQSFTYPIGVYVVADGMGGHAAGEIASGMIVQTIAQKAASDLIAPQAAPGVNQDRQQWLHDAVELANKAVFDMRKSAGTDMGSTLVIALLETNKAYVTHVGDSRVYLINAQGIRQITVDHSLVERLIATKQITREEARYHPQRNVIYRTVGDKPKVDLEISVHTLSPGDRLLLCSDGLSGMVEDKTIQRIIMESRSPQAACEALIAAANAAGGDDNVTAILVEIAQP